MKVVNDIFAEHKVMNLQLYKRISNSYDKILIDLNLQLLSRKKKMVATRKDCNQAVVGVSLNEFEFSWVNNKMLTSNK